MKGKECDNKCPEPRDRPATSYKSTNKTDENGFDIGFSGYKVTVWPPGVASFSSSCFLS